MNPQFQLPPAHTPKSAFALPDGATDTHIHVFGPHDAFPFPSSVADLPPETPPALVARVFADIGISRCVLIQPTTYGHDNSRHLTAAAEIGVPSRVVVSVSTEVSTGELEDMHRQGARGVRFVINPAMNKNAASWADIERIAAKVAPFGWHAQILLTPEQLLDRAPAIAKLPCDVVFDHFALIDPQTPAGAEAAGILRNLLETGRCWTKISALYRGTAHPGALRDVSGPVRSMLDAAPDRLLWGSDWPHSFYPGQVPTLAQVLDPLAELVPDERQRRMILVDNPAKLYGFTSGGKD